MIFQPTSQLIAYIHCRCRVGKTSVYCKTSCSVALLCFFVNRVSKLNKFHVNSRSNNANQLRELRTMIESIN